MDTFLNNENKNKLLIGCKNMLNKKFNIIVDDNDLQNNLNVLFSKIENDKSLYDHELKYLNSICLTNIKNHYLNNNNENKNKYSLDYITNKITELEFERNGNYIEEDDTNNNYYNNEVNIKSFVISSLEYSNNLVKIDRNNYYYPNKLILPKLINNISPYIILKLYDNDVCYTYNFICTYKNDLWDIWITNDKYKIDFKNDYMKYTINYFNNKIIKFNQPKVKIINYNTSNDLFSIRLVLEKPVFLQVKDNITIEINNNIYQKQIINIIDNNTIDISNINTNIDINNLINSFIYIYKEQHSIIMNYHNK